MSKVTGLLVHSGTIGWCLVCVLYMQLSPLTAEWRKWSRVQLRSFWWMNFISVQWRMQLFTSVLEEKKKKETCDCIYFGCEFSIVLYSETFRMSCVFASFCGAMLSPCWSKLAQTKPSTETWCISPVLLLGCWGGPASPACWIWQTDEILCSGITSGSGGCSPAVLPAVQYRLKYKVWSLTATKTLDCKETDAAAQHKVFTPHWNDSNSFAGHCTAHRKTLVKSKGCCVYSHTYWQTHCLLECCARFTDTLLLWTYRRNTGTMLASSLLNPL